jgi:hypothetical protein
MTYDHDFCILFFYHKCDEVTKYHLANLRKWNPGAIIVPVTDSVPELLPGSIDVAQFPSSWPEAQKWRSVDTTLYRWFENRTFNARRYLIVEYDCLCTVDLNEYYSEVSDADVAGIDLFKMAENPRWKWFVKELDALPAEDRKHASGIVPLTCTLFSHDALEEIVRHVYRHDVFAELRLGTIITKLGLRFRRLPVLKRSTICWHAYSWQANRSGLFHAVKSLDHNSERLRQPGAVGSRMYDLLRSCTHDRELLPFFLQGKRHGVKRRLGLERAVDAS